MTMDRRTVLRIAACSTAGLAASRFALASSGRAIAPPAMYFDWKPLRGDHVLTAAGPVGNMVMILAKDKSEAVLIDTHTAPFGAELRREGESLGHKVSTVINTHHHPEVTGGNHAFTPDTRVIGHVHAKPRIESQVHRYISQVKEFLFRDEDARNPRAMAAVREDWLALHRRIASLKAEQFMPTQLLSAEKTEMDVGGRKLVILAPAADTGAHTDNDLIIHLPDDNVVVVGGLVSSLMHPVIDRDSGANTTGWLRALTTAESLCKQQTIVVPAEGNVGGISLISAQRQYLSVLREAVEKAVSLGKSRQEVRRLRPRVRVTNGASEQRLEMSLDSIFDEVTAEKATPGPAIGATPEKKGH